MIEVCRIVIDYILIKKSEEKLISDVEVTRDDSCFRQQKLLVCVLDLKEKLERLKVKFLKRYQVWEMKEFKIEEVSLGRYLKY